MVIEEYYDNILLLTRLETLMNNIFNHQIYMHYNIFASTQSVLASLDLYKKQATFESNKDTLQ